MFQVWWNQLFLFFLTLHDHFRKQTQSSRMMGVNLIFFVGFLNFKNDMHCVYFYNTVFSILTEIRGING